MAQTMDFSGKVWIIGAEFAEAKSQRIVNNKIINATPDTYILYVLAGAMIKKQNLFRSEPYVSRVKVSKEDYERFISGGKLELTTGTGTATQYGVTIEELEGYNVLGKAEKDVDIIAADIFDENADKFDAMQPKEKKEKKNA